MKYLGHHGTKNLNYQMGHILFWKFKIILSILPKKHGKLSDNPPIRIYVNKTENRIIFKTKEKYYLELLTHETMKLLRSTKSNIDKTSLI